MFIKCKLAQHQESSFSNPGPPRCYEQGSISAILWGDNNSIDTTDKARGKNAYTEKLFIKPNTFYNTFIHIWMRIYVKTGVLLP